MPNIAHIKKLDTESLQMLMRFDPFRIRAQQATPEAIQACRRLGVELLLVPSEEPKPNKDEDGTACEGGGCAGACHGVHRARTRGMLGAKVFIGQSDVRGFWRAFSSEDMEKVVGNAGIRIRIKDPVTECISTDYHGSIFGYFAKALKKAGYIPGQTYEQCLEMAKWHPGMAEFLTKKLPGGVGSDTQKQQFGYVQTYLADGSLII